MNNIITDINLFTERVIVSLVNKDFAVISEVFDNDVIMFYPRSIEAWYGLAEVFLNLMGKETYSQTDYQLLEKHYQTISINDNAFIVFGNAKVNKIIKNISPKILTFRFTLFGVINEGTIKVSHLHLTDVEAEMTHNNFLQQAIELQHMYTQIDPDLMSCEYIFGTKQFVFSQAMASKFNHPYLINAIDYKVYMNTILVEESKESFFAMLDQITAAEVTNKIVFKIILHAKEMICELYATPIFDNAKNPIRSIIMIKDITKHNLNERESLFAKAMAIEDTIICEINLDTNEILFLKKEWSDSLAIPEVKKYSELLKIIVNYYTDSNYRELFSNFVSPSMLHAAYKRGEFHGSIQFKQKNLNHINSWVQATYILIIDPITKQLCVRFHLQNIDELKAKEEKIREEKQRYSAVLSRTNLAFEANLSKDTIKSNMKSSVIYQIPSAELYSVWVNEFCDIFVHSEDVTHFKKCFCSKYLLQTYKNGINEVTCEYRRVNQEGSVIWESATLDLIMDETSKDIKCFGYIQNINEGKNKELDLLFKAEHDNLTGLYNKYATELKIKEILASAEGAQQTHAFLIIDIDHFKSINDHFGHVFGDIILSQIAKKIKGLFRTNDIIGRIGGDEFIVLMKNCMDEKTSSLKAKELCLALENSLTQRGKKYHVSVSVGIAHYPNNGLTYSELYNHSDIALYCAKEGGRNQFIKYVSNMNSSISVINSIDTNSLIENKPFDKNIAEYIFRILYESEDKYSSINSVLELVGKEYDVSRTYVFEETADYLGLTNTFEWCNKGIEPAMELLNYVSYAELSDYPSNFNEQGIFYLPSIDVAPAGIRLLLEKQKIISMLQFKIVSNGRFAGFIGFDNCTFARIPSKEEASELRYIANLLGTFLMDMRKSQKLITSNNVILSIVNGLDSYSYVIDPETYILLFINSKTVELTQSNKIGIPCYESFWHTNKPCNRCPMRGLKKLSNEKNKIDLYNPNYKVWVNASASWITWKSGDTACLIESVDITKYMKDVELSH